MPKIQKIRKIDFIRVKKALREGSSAKKIAKEYGYGETTVYKIKNSSSYEMYRAKYCGSKSRKAGPKPPRKPAKKPAPKESELELAGIVIEEVEPDYREKVIKGLGIALSVLAFLVILGLIAGVWLIWRHYAQ